MKHCEPYNQYSEVTGGAKKVNLMNMIEGKHGKAALNAFTMQSFGSFLTNRSTVKHHALRCAMAGYGELDPAAWDTSEERWKCVEGVSIFVLRFLYQLKERERPNTRGGSCSR